METSVSSKISYAEAVGLVNKALQSSSERCEDKILATVVALFFYEKNNSPFVTGVALAHLNGLEKLVKARGTATFIAHKAQLLLWSVRAHVVANYMSPLQGKVADDELWIDPLTGMFQGAAMRLITIVSALSTLRKSTKKVAAMEGGMQL